MAEEWESHALLHSRTILGIQGTTQRSTQGFHICFERNTIRTWPPLDFRGWIGPCQSNSCLDSRSISLHKRIFRNPHLLQVNIDLVFLRQRRITVQEKAGHRPPVWPFGKSGQSACDTCTVANHCCCPCSIIAPAWLFRVPISQRHKHLRGLFSIPFQQGQSADGQVHHIAHIPVQSEIFETSETLRILK